MAIIGGFEPVVSIDVEITAARTPPWSEPETP
jgi:hypothetical protein